MSIPAIQECSIPPRAALLAWRDMWRMTGPWLIQCDGYEPRKDMFARDMMISIMSGPAFKLMLVVVRLKFVLFGWRLVTLEGDHNVPEVPVCFELF
eukprot:scaffold18793_cov54-Cyclotella_meneghiniana.AAC.2